MRHFRALAMASAFFLAPAGITATLAASGSDVPPATNRAASPGAVSNGQLGTVTGNSVSPTSGTAGGGLSSANGQKAGGAAHRRRHRYHHKKSTSTMAPAGTMAPATTAP
ncbi:hypothetical protein [Acidisoma sp. S159]|jgi:hypothetical protein|uniref:hypothetical protein n=1 Tax=Acidisoma sp. S159 TaxID=1747225 RepID=UPI00131B430A|nr:hypothetical protein [Acidisoma sp. S159]